MLKSALINEGSRYNYFGDPKTTKFGNRVGWAGYTFEHPTAKKQYVWILKSLLDGPKTKAQVHFEIGLPDPTDPATKNSHTSTWQELRAAGLIDYTREGNSALWFITDRGRQYLKDNNLDTIPTDENDEFLA